MRTHSYIQRVAVCHVGEDQASSGRRLCMAADLEAEKAGRSCGGCCLPWPAPTDDSLSRFTSWRPISFQNNTLVWGPGTSQIQLITAWVLNESFRKLVRGEWIWDKLGFSKVWASQSHIQISVQILGQRHSAFNQVLVSVVRLWGISGQRLSHSLACSYCALIWSAVLERCSWIFMYLMSE